MTDTILITGNTYPVKHGQAFVLTDDDSHFAATRNEATAWILST